MAWKKYGVSLVGVLLALVCVVSWVIFPAEAADADSLTLSYVQDDVTFEIYRVAVLNDSAYELTGSFAQYSVDLPAGDWTDTAVTLEAYAQMDSIAPDRSGTISGGSLTFTGLEAGLYLVVGESTVLDGCRFTPAAFLVYVEGDVTSVVKYSETQETAEPVSCTVKKVWSNDTKAVRPSSVTVLLLKDGEEYDRQKLSGSKDWSYTWEGLDASADWQLAEVDVAESYTVSVAQDGNSFTVTNTYHKEISTTTTTTTTTTTGTTSSSQGTKLPQTGQLWWPVVLLGAAGIILVVVGALWTKKKKP